MSSDTPLNRHSDTTSASTSPTAVTLDFEDMALAHTQGLRNRAQGQMKATHRRAGEEQEQDNEEEDNPRALLLPTGNASSANVGDLLPARTRKMKNPAAQRPAVDVRRLGNFKQKIGMLQDSRNLRFRKIYKAPDPIVIAVFIGSILLWYVLFNYLKTWK